MKQDDDPTNERILVAICAALFALVIILVAPLFLLGWGVCEALREIVKAVRRAYSSLSRLGEQTVKRTLKRKLPQSANATRRKHNVRQR